MARRISLELERAHRPAPQASAANPLAAISPDERAELPALPRDLPQWEDEDKKKDPIFWAGPVLAGDRLIVISSDGEAISVSPYTGLPLGHVGFPDGVFINPIVADRTLFVLTDVADLIALR